MNTTVDSTSLAPVAFPPVEQILLARGSRERDLLAMTRHRDHLLLAQPGAPQRDGHS